MQVQMISTQIPTPSFLIILTYWVETPRESRIKISTEFWPNLAILLVVPDFGHFEKPT